MKIVFFNGNSHCAPAYTCSEPGDRTGSYVSFTDYDALAVENVALLEALKYVVNNPHFSEYVPRGLLDKLSSILSNPSPQVAEIEAVLEAAKEWHKARTTPDGAQTYCCQEEIDLHITVRNLRGDK